jgi:hypothetical protein
MLIGEQRDYAVDLVGLPGASERRLLIDASRTRWAARTASA